MDAVVSVAHMASIKVIVYVLMSTVKGHSERIHFWGLISRYPAGFKNNGNRPRICQTHAQGKGPNSRSSAM